MTTDKDFKYILSFYQDTAGGWRWRILHRNRNLIAEGGQGYTRKVDCEKAIRRLLETPAYQVRWGDPE